MRAVDLINKLREAEERMEAAQARVTVSKSIAEKTTATLSGERGNGNGHVSAHEDAIIRLMEAEALYEQSALAYNQMVDEIMKLLQCIGDTEKSNVAVAVIINKQRYKTVAKQYLPPYSPDLNPIEMLWSKMKAILRKLGCNIAVLLPQMVAHALALVSPEDCFGWFTADGY